MSRRRRRPLTAACLVVLVSLATGCSTGADVERAWVQYRRALFADDRPALRALLAADVAPSLDGPDAETALAMVREMAPARARVVQARVDGNTAVLELEADDPDGLTTGEVELVREGGRWKVRHESWEADLGTGSIANVDYAALLEAAPAPPENIAAVMAHEGGVTEAVFTRDGMYVVTIGYGDFYLRLWDAETVDLVAEVELERRPHDLCLLPDGSAAIVVDAYGNVTRWPLEWGAFGEPEVLAGDAGSSSQMAVDPTGRWLATTDFEGPVRVWDLETRAVAKTLPRSDKQRGVAFSPLGPVVVCGGLDNHVTTWRPDAKLGGRKSYRVKGASEGSDIWSVDVSRDGRRMATGHMDSSISIWDLAKGKQLHDFYVQDVSVHDVQFSPCGTVLAAAGQDGRVRLWETETRRLLTSLPAHEGAATAVAFQLADGVTIATGGEDGVLRIWRPNL